MTVIPELGLGIVLLLVVAMMLWFFSSSTRADEKRREDRESKRMSRQPWDAEGAGRRGNR
jgi:hypothetical protein